MLGQKPVRAVGLNLDPGPEGFPREIADRAAALSETQSGSVHAATLMATLLGEMENAIDMAQSEPEELRQAWLALSDTIGREVRAELGGESRTGRAVDQGVALSLKAPTASAT